MQRPIAFRRPSPLPRFAPGDLVTAERLNTLIDAIDRLTARVAALERR